MTNTKKSTRILCIVSALLLVAVSCFVLFVPGETALAEPVGSSTLRKVFHFELVDILGADNPGNINGQSFVVDGFTFTFGGSYAVNSFSTSDGQRYSSIHFGNSSTFGAFTVSAPDYLISNLFVFGTGFDSVILPKSESYISSTYSLFVSYSLSSGFALQMFNTDISYLDIYVLYNDIGPGFDYDSVYDSGYNSGFADGMNAGYDSGYNNGFLNGTSSGFDNGYSDGYQDGLSDGRNQGFASGYDYGYGTANSEVNESSASYEAGYSRGETTANNTVTESSASYGAGFTAGVSSASDYSFISLIGAVIDVPLQAFQSLFNFEILGINMTNFVSSLFTLLVLIAVGKILIGFFL